MNFQFVGQRLGKECLWPVGIHLLGHQLWHNECRCCTSGDQRGWRLNRAEGGRNGQKLLRLSIPSDLGCRIRVCCPRFDLARCFPVGRFLGMATSHGDEIQYYLYTGILAVHIVNGQPYGNDLCAVQRPIGKVLMPRNDFRIAWQLAKVVSSYRCEMGSEKVFGQVEYVGVGNCEMWS